MEILLLSDDRVVQCRNVEEQESCEIRVCIPGLDMILDTVCAAGVHLCILPGTSTRYTKLQRITAQYNAVHQLLSQTCLNGLRLRPGKSLDPRQILYSAVH